MRNQREKRFEEINLRDNLVQNQTLQIMSLQDVKESLSESRLNFDSGIANDVCLFFTQNGIEIDEYKVFLQSVAAAAIISEAKIALSNESPENAGNEVTFETAMNHLNKKSKEEFIEIIQSMISKNSTLQQKLSSKIKNLDISYRLFKKYRETFEDLCKETRKDTKIHEFVLNDLLSIFWVIYLLFKSKKHEHFEEFSQQVKLLIVVIKSIFQYWASCLPEEVVEQKIEAHFKDKVENLINEQFFLLHHAELSNLAQKLYSIRYKNQTMDFKRFSKNPIKIAKFLNDISIYYSKERQRFEFENQVDELSFLNLHLMVLSLNYGMRPKTVEKEVENNVIQNNLGGQNYSAIKEQKQDDRKQNRVEPKIPVPKQTSHFIIAQNLHKLTPLRDRKDNAGVTPCHSRMINLEWIRNCLYYMCRPEANPTFNRVFNFVQKQSLIDFEFKARKQLFQLVQEFTPKCIRKENRVNDMLAFFKYIIIKVYQDHDHAQNAQMFKQVKAFNAILCLSCDIFNFAYNSLMSSYRRVCQIFEVPLVEALKPINWIGKNISKPAELNNYLYALEKRIVIKEIWEDQTGYNLLKSQQNYNQSSSIGYNDMIVWRRLIKHIFDRVDELSREVKLEHKLTKRIQHLIDTILKQKPFLLHKNKIDQIIICCMTSFLSINQITQKNTLEKVFKDYNRMDLSQNQNRQGLSGDGRQMTLSEFYNEVFLPEIQDIVEKNITETDFLLTPIRQSYHQKVTTHQGLVTPFTKKYPENQIDAGQNFRPVELTNSSGLRLQGLSFIKSHNSLITPHNYRAKLVSQQQKMEEEEEGEDEEVSKSKNSSQRMSERSDEQEESEQQKSVEESNSQSEEKSQKLQNSEIENSESSLEDEVKSSEKEETPKEEKEEIKNGVHE